MRVGGRRDYRMLAAVAAGLLAVTGLATCDSPSRAGGSRWALAWRDPFAGPAGSRVSVRYWRYNTGHGIFGNDEIETMTRSPRNVHTDGHGVLDITALGSGQTWTSGRIQTWRAFVPPPGGELKVTASIRQPGPVHGLGYWPAFWLLGPGQWPGTGEIDILEDVNALSRHSGTLHCGNLTQRNPDGTFGPCHEDSGLGSGLRPCPGCQTGYHTYSVIIDRRRAGGERIVWFLDGRPFFAAGEQQVGRRPWLAAMRSGFTVIFDIAMGGAYPDYECRCRTPTPATPSGGTMSVRYVSVWTRG
jgi:beta-glucanase (GH16 family)